MEIGCDGLEKHGVIGLGTFFDQRRYQRRVCGARGDVMVYSYITEAIKVDIVVRWTASRSCTMAVSKADRGLDAGNTLADYTSAGASTLLPILELDLIISQRA
jgi:hypothetical protein